MVSHAGAVRDVIDAAVPRIVAILAAVLPIGLLAQVLGELGDYRHPAVPVAVWLSLLVAALWLIPRVRDGGLTRGQAAIAVAVALVAVSAVGWDRRPHVPAGALDWSILGAVWLLALAAISRPAWEWIPGALLVLAVNGFFILRLLGTRRAGDRPARGRRVRGGDDPERVRRPAARLTGPRRPGRPRGRAGQPLRRGTGRGDRDPGGPAGPVRAAGTGGAPVAARHRQRLARPGRRRGAPEMRPARDQPAPRPGRPGPARPRTPGRAGARAQRGPAARPAGRGPGGGGSRARRPGR